MSNTALRYKKLYEMGRVDAAGIARAAARGLITPAKAEEILAEG